MTVEITCATPDRVPDLATLIGRAFSDDPMALWPLHPDAAEEEVRLWFLWFDEEYQGARVGNRAESLLRRARDMAGGRRR